MSPLFIDLCHFDDGRWEVRRHFPAAGIAHVQAGERVMPLEICPDGSWVVSGWPQNRFIDIFGFPPEEALPWQFGHVVDYLRFLRSTGFLPSIGHDGADRAPVPAEHARWFDPLIDLINDATSPRKDERLLDRIAHAPATSLAGILRLRGAADLAFGFLRHCPQNALPLAFVPLYLDVHATEDGSHGFQFLYKMDLCDGHARPWPFVCTHRSVLINTQGTVRATDLAVLDARLPSEMAHQLRPTDFRGAIQPIELPCTDSPDIHRDLHYFSSTLRRVASTLAIAGREHMIESGIHDPRRSHQNLRGPVLGILHPHAWPTLKRMRNALRQCDHPFDIVTGNTTPENF